MLRTLTRELRPGVIVTVQEPTNQGFYDSRLLYRRFINESDDGETHNFKVNFILIATRTIDVEGVPLLSAHVQMSDEEWEREFVAFMALPRLLSEGWITLASDVGVDPVVEATDAEEKKSPEGEPDKPS